MKIQDLGVVAKKSKGILADLKAKYPQLDAYIVLSSRLGQVELTTQPDTIILEFPAAFVPSPDKLIALKLIDDLKKLKREVDNAGPKDKTSLQKTFAAMEEHLHQKVLGLEVDDEVQVELRFGNLNYDLIAKLQEDPLVDPKLTPQTRASIRIVLGTIRAIFDSKPS